MTDPEFEAFWTDRIGRAVPHRRSAATLCAAWTKVTAVVEQFVNFLAQENRFRRTSAEDEELVQRSLIGHFSDELACGVSTALPRLLIPRRRGTSRLPLLFLVTRPVLVPTSGP
ncbi:hypothetical protein CPLU01_04850 [Colletotrichum plurivorum]|uniref:Uncharacterized protein n=1 Tax=Colletotrichum plurivorum TaxID=2175906 RepID=A0A8H6KNG3_9PEZI|nr:hypothetical protein CPLU01_04850 [Colletotrichum plurivorum]